MAATKAEKEPINQGLNFSDFVLLPDPPAEKNDLVNVAAPESRCGALNAESALEAILLLFSTDISPYDNA